LYSIDPVNAMKSIGRTTHADAIARRQSRRRGDLLKGESDG